MDFQIGNKPNCRTVLIKCKQQRQLTDCSRNYPQKRRSHKKLELVPCCSKSSEQQTSVVDVAEESEGDVDDGGSSSINTAGAGTGWVSPKFITELGRLWGGKSDVAVVDAGPDDIKDLLGGALFKALFKWMEEYGPVYLLPTGPISSFLVVSDPDAAKHVLSSTDKVKNNVYNKGKVTEVSEFLFGKGFAVAQGENWRVRRKSVGPSLHRAYLEVMLDRVFSGSAVEMNKKLELCAKSGEAIDMEQVYSQLTLDVIGKSVFNYEFNALTADSPIIQAVYTALKETEQRALDLLPYWQYDFINQFVPRQRKALAAVQEIRQCTETLIAKCKEMVSEEETKQFSEEYINQLDPSVLRFLIVSRDEVSSEQLRDDLLSMLVAGHETTASTLTWTLYLLMTNPSAMAAVVEEVDRVCDGKESVTLGMYKELKYTTRCVLESLRMYPHPPVLLRRAEVVDTLPGGYEVPIGQDVMISVYNIHRSPAVWDNPDDFKPERFPLDQPLPNEQNTNFKFIPFSGGPRKCVGDQFALMEAVVAIALGVQRFEFSLKKGQTIGMTTGATIHTSNGLFVNVKER